MKILVKKCFLMSQSSLCGHSLKLNKKRVRLEAWFSCCSTCLCSSNTEIFISRLVTVHVCVRRTSHTAEDLWTEWFSLGAAQTGNNSNKSNTNTNSFSNENHALDVAKFSFSNRVVNEWNILDEEIILGCSLVGFKWKLDRHIRHKRGYI